MGSIAFAFLLVHAFSHEPYLHHIKPKKLFIQLKTLVSLVLIVKHLQTEDSTILYERVNGDGFEMDNIFRELKTYINEI